MIWYDMIWYDTLEEQLAEAHAGQLALRRALAEAEAASADVVITKS